jgi:hypothetical protein
MNVAQLGPAARLFTSAQMRSDWKYSTIQKQFYPMLTIGFLICNLAGLVTLRCISYQVLTKS